MSKAILTTRKSKLKYRRRLGVVLIVLFYIFFMYFLGFLNSGSEFLMGEVKTPNQLENYWQGEFSEYIAGTTGFISINNSTQEELESLSGIGAVIAERIILYRNENGDFSEMEDLLYVKGIGEATLETIKPYIVIE